jgi:hypothetical protein
MVDSSSDRRADLVWSLLWVVIGAAIFYGGWTMDRLEKLNINPYTAPGLVPAALGVGIALLGVLLLVRSVRDAHTSSSASSDGPAPAEANYSARRLILSLILCLSYGAGLVGRGMPFWLATFLFVLVTIVVLQWRERRERGGVLRGLLIAAACAAGTAIGVTLVFQELFLVRLP